MDPRVAEPEMAAGDLVDEVPERPGRGLRDPVGHRPLGGHHAQLGGSLGRALVHGGRGRDPRRTSSRGEKAELLRRAGHRCEHHSRLLGRCREAEALQADHVHPHSWGGATDVVNGQALCQRNNKRKSARVPWNRELDRLARRRKSYFSSGTPTAVARYGAPAGQPVEV